MFIVQNLIKSDTDYAGRRPNPIFLFNLTIKYKEII